MRKVFISYSHRDKRWLERLRVHLAPLERDQKIDVWDDSRINSGLKWHNEIKKALRNTKAAILLVSADFLASDFINTHELPVLLDIAERRGAIILPLIVSPSQFAKHPRLSKYQAVNDPSRPLIGLRRVNQEQILLQLAERIEAAAGENGRLLATSRDRSTIANQALGQTIAILFVDLMRLIYVAAGVVIRRANITRYGEFVTTADTHLDDLNIRIKAFSPELDAEIRRKIFRLKRKLSSMLGQLRRSSRLPETNQYFEVMNKVGDELNDLCSTTIGPKYQSVVRKLNQKLDRELKGKREILHAYSPDDLCLLRFKIQDQVLDEARKSGGTTIFSIADDLDQDFAVEYFAIDQLLLARLHQTTGFRSVEI
jgi:hypothetical protein